MQNARITLHPSQQRMQVRVDGILLADSTNTVELREHCYPPRRYFPREDVRMDLLTVSETTTYCPFKGHAVYFRWVSGGILLGVMRSRLRRWKLLRVGWRFMGK